MEIRKALCQRILVALQGRTSERFMLAEAVPGEDADALVAHVLYLEEHGLVTSHFAEFQPMSRFRPTRLDIGRATLTARGHDYLAADGGLTRELGTLTVRLDEDQLRLLLETEVQQATLPPEQKSSLLKAIRNAPAKALETLVAELTKQAVTRLPDAVQLVQNGLDAAKAAL